MLSVQLRKEDVLVEHLYSTWRCSLRGNQSHS